MSSSENTLSTTTLQVAGFNFILLPTNIIFACCKWAAAAASLKMDMQQLVQVHLLFSRISFSKSIFILGLLSSCEYNFPRWVKTKLCPGDRRGPIRFTPPTAGTPSWSTSSWSTSSSPLSSLSSSMFVKWVFEKAPFSWALPLFKTPCPSTDAGLFSDDSQAMTFQVSQLGQLLHCWELLWTLPFFSQESSQEDYSRLVIYFLAHSLFFPFLQLLQIWIAGCDVKLLQDFMTNLLEHSLFLELTLRIESRNFSTKKKHIVRRSQGKLWVLI